MQNASFVINGAKGIQTQGQLITLQNDHLDEVNLLTVPMAVSPKGEPLKLTGN
ncbi:hypothetical protein HH214_02790 [Mucilaginibacter robiniae]|uniref:Uncharacterized protein n=1 Tax=Mucilaginibacter robiniae TaxID=2728022 RepID=A0A7L5DUV1_9SPHI|nr:hypothetical protein [Mucilaginibacter robiniae]QJD94880.1 hypothetical protein HH214_02790 [Mucilaginibacter robiniae]